jgi:CHAT domain
MCWVMARVNLKLSSNLRGLKMKQRTEIRSLKLELLRAGPTHNQLLSPLTNYIALCGSAGPVTINIPFEHRQLLMRLKRLKYPLDKDPATDDQRQAELRDIGESLGRIFAEVPALISELGAAAAEKGNLVHLSLSMSAFELGLLPFEAAIAAEGFPGTGAPLFLQTRTPVSITREVRRGRPLPMNWVRAPKILFAFAAPAGTYVPAQSHLQALRQAIEPWVKRKDSPEERILEVKKLLTVLPQATLEQIRSLCATEEFTHVHILAHGAPYQQAGNEHYGVALCSEAGPDQIDVVDGERLAIALTASNASGTAHRSPTVVTLATCDSGNINSVLAPGGSIAHELNSSGIPWVIASQFPLWMKASAIAAKVLYSGLLNGDDPRWVLQGLRQRLRTDAPETHDWASIVAYATIPPDFALQVQQFHAAQTQRKIEVKFDRIDELVKTSTPCGATSNHQASIHQELTEMSEAIRQALKEWRDEPHDHLTKTEWAMRLGLSAASEKRIGIALTLIEDTTKAEHAYKCCFQFYRDAWTIDPANHWLLTQYLSIIAIRKRADGAEALHTLSEKYGTTLSAALEMTYWKKGLCSGGDKVYVLATLAELTLLKTVYHPDKASMAGLRSSIQDYCKDMLLEPLDDKFPIFSTQRQFARYLLEWKSDIWKDLAQAAVDALAGEQ